MVTTRSGKSLEAPQMAGPSGGSRKRKASEPPPERQRTPSPPFARPDSPSRQLFMDLEAALGAVTDLPSCQLLSELNASLSSPSTPSSPPRRRSHARSPTPPLPRRARPPRQVSLFDSLTASLASTDSSPHTLPPRPGPFDERRMLKWVDYRVQAYIRENGPFKTADEYERVSKIFRRTYIARAPNEPRVDPEEVEAQLQVDKYRRSVVGTPEFEEAKKRKRMMKREVMKEGDYERQNMLNQVEATDFEYPPMSKKEMMRTREPLLGRRERVVILGASPSTSPEASGYTTSSPESCPATHPSSPSPSLQGSSQANSSTSPNADPSAHYSPALAPTAPAAGPVGYAETEIVDVNMMDAPSPVGSGANMMDAPSRVSSGANMMDAPSPVDSDVTMTDAEIVPDARARAAAPAPAAAHACGRWWTWVRSWI